MKIKEKMIYTLVQDEIPLHQDSVEYLDILSKYEKVDEFKKQFKSPVIHLYAKRDTYDENGDLDGYKDALFFECYIYEPDTMTVYKSPRLHDTVRFNEATPNDVRIFKDGSTLLSFFGEVEVELLTSVHTWNVKKITQ
jgi:hypothetical protein